MEQVNIRTRIGTFSTGERFAINSGEDFTLRPVNPPITGLKMLVFGDDAVLDYKTGPNGHTVTFTARKAGTCELQFQRRRPRTTDELIWKTIRVIVNEVGASTVTVEHIATRPRT